MAAILCNLTNLVKQSTLPFMAKGKKIRKVKEPVSLYDAKTHLSELVEQAALGREITIAKSGKPKARLVPFAPKGTRHPRKPGGAKGKVWIAPDFDAPLPPEMLKVFGGESA
jgi:prevent-host-death family protein